jgi:hypothetical protein
MIMPLSMTNNRKEQSAWRMAQRAWRREHGAEGKEQSVVLKDIISILPKAKRSSSETLLKRSALYVKRSF